MAGESEQRPFLDRIEVDSRTTLIVMRWMRFLAERAEPESLPDLFGYYSRIGWISEEVKDYLLAVADGTRPVEPLFDQDTAEKEVGDRSLVVVSKQGQQRSGKRKEPDAVDWRLDPNDHLKSWMFVMEIAGSTTDKNLWCELGHKLDRFESGVDEFCRI